MPKKNWKNSLLSSFGKRGKEEQTDNKETPNQKVVSQTEGVALQKLINALVDNNNELKNTNNELKNSNRKMLEALKQQQELSEKLVNNIKEPTKIVVPMNNISNNADDSEAIFIPDLTKSLDSGKSSSISINEENSKKNSSLDEASAALKNLKKKKN